VAKTINTSRTVDTGAFLKPDKPSVYSIKEKGVPSSVRKSLSDLARDFPSTRIYPNYLCRLGGEGYNAYLVAFA